MLNSFVVILLCMTILIACGNKDVGGGFTETKTTKVTETKISKIPNIKQPCSLISKEQAAVVLGVNPKHLDKPESSQPDKATLRCRYSALSRDSKLYLVLNIYIFTKQSDFDLIRKSHNATKIETTVDEGFYYDITTSRQSERFVAARDGDIRIGVSSSIAVVDSDKTLDETQIVLPTADTLAQLVGSIIADLQ